MASQPPVAYFRPVFEHCIPSQEDRQVLLETLYFRTDRPTRRNTVHLVFQGTGHGKRSLQWLIHTSFGGYIDDGILYLGSVIISIADTPDQINRKVFGTIVPIMFTAETIRGSAPGIAGKRRCISITFSTTRHVDDFVETVNNCVVN